MKFISDTLVVVSVTPNGIFVAHLRGVLEVHQVFYDSGRV